MAFFLLAFCGSEKKSLSGAAGLSSPEEAHLKAMRAEMASTKDFYLELSLRAKTMKICHSGVYLRKFAIKSIVLETKRFLFFNDQASGRWTNRLYLEGELFPNRVLERVKIIPGDETTRPTPEKPGIVPPTMEEIIAVPISYSLVFPDDFALKIDLLGEIPGKSLEIKKTSLIWNDFLIGAGLKKGPCSRLRLEMDSKEGAAFYRSCPQKAKMIVLP